MRDDRSVLCSAASRGCLQLALLLGLSWAQVALNGRLDGLLQLRVAVLHSCTADQGIIEQSRCRRIGAQLSNAVCMKVVQHTMGCPQYHTASLRHHTGDQETGIRVQECVQGPLLLLHQLRCLRCSSAARPSTPQDAGRHAVTRAHEQRHRRPCCPFDDEKEHINQRR